VRLDETGLGFNAQTFSVREQKSKYTSNSSLHAGVWMLLLSPGLYGKLEIGIPGHSLHFKKPKSLVPSLNKNA
jgi:hypothetical protein